MALPVDPVESGLFPGLAGSGLVAGDAGAFGTQEGVGINTGVVGVVPQKLDGVFADLHLIDGPHVFRNGGRVQSGPTGHFFHAIGATTPQAQQSVRINTPVSIIPEDDDLISGYVDFLGFHYFGFHYFRFHCVVQI
jgi:hypothetical protein